MKKDEYDLLHGFGDSVVGFGEGLDSGDVNHE